jgi:hypothetical protein
MSKKAGPKRIDPDTFYPAVWVAEHDGTAFLVCQKRWMRLNPVTGGPKNAVATAEWFIHGAAIRLQPEIEILLGFRLCSGTWRPTNPLDFGISKHCAQIALAEAWHGVKINLDAATMAAHISCNGETWSKHKNGVRVRNIIAAMVWDRWNKERIPVADRAEILTASGFPCTAAQLSKFAEDRGI